MTSEDIPERLANRPVCPNGCTNKDKPGDANQQIIGEGDGKRGVNWLWCNVCGDEPVPYSEVY